MLVTCAQFQDPTEAHIVRERLDAEGIPAFVVDDGHVRINWPWSLALGGAKIRVPENFKAQADAILAAYARGDFCADVDAEAGSSPPGCPACGSTSISRSVPGHGKALAVALFAATGVVIRTEASRSRCSQCQWQWDAER